MTRKTYPELFERWWNAYPRHVAKHKAAIAWDNAGVRESDMPRVMAALERAKCSRQWVKDNGKFIPHPTTYIHGRRWDDEIPDRELMRKPQPVDDGSAAGIGVADIVTDEF